MNILKHVQRFNLQEILYIEHLKNKKTILFISESTYLKGWAIKKVFTTFDIVLIQALLWQNKIIFFRINQN